MVGEGDDEVDVARDSSLDAEGDLDDATLEDEAVDRFGDFGIVDVEGSLLDGGEGNDQLVVGEESDMMAGAEIGLLEDSHEGDGREVTSDEAGIAPDDESEGDEDGGAEGTGDDPAAAIAQEREGRDATDLEDDDGFEDARFDDGVRAQAADREPWPPRADVAWTVSRAESIAAFAGVGIHTSHGDVIVAVEEGALVLSTNGGVSFTRIAGCTGVTAATVVAVPDVGVAVLAALHDRVREASAVVRVRIVEHPVAEVLCDFLADDEDEDVRITSLRARTPNGPAIEALAEGAFGARLLRSTKA